ncbi:sigma-70 family RNA polymerase sigma factor [Eubacterium sp. 14-2]|uniref:RNA polymerase sigma factor n=1 Tax=Eubacterium sp. 14-2 TaxID=1235790 RepID=UPI000335809A|nr:sigma-70 family RNA polymerase sigma factor [Eubacterium sp. 14-2]EOT26599.1 sigma-70 family RNA polymerase sigma factor [Eubacterium sp. 14-2]
MFRYLLLLETDEEREFFKFIYQEYRQEMFCVARAILKNEADAEDMVHETFLILTDHLNKIINSESYKVRDYIITTVRHRCFNLYRKRKIQECSGLEEWEPGEILEKGPDTILEETELKEAVTGLLKELKSPYGEVLTLQYYHEMSFQEIAEEMDTTPDNVRHISMRARKKLQSILEERGLWNEKEGFCP